MILRVYLVVAVIVIYFLHVSFEQVNTLAEVKVPVQCIMTAILCLFFYDCNGC